MTQPKRGGDFVFETVKAIHEAIHSESTWAFILTVVIAFALVGGIVAFIVDKGYKNAVAESQIERRLTEWQKTKLRANLSRYAGSKMVIMASEGEDTWAYAKDFRTIFLKTGWKVNGPIQAPSNVAAVDVQLSVNSKYFGGNPPPPEAFETLQGTLAFLNIRCRNSLVMDPHVPENVVLVWIGGKGIIPPANYPPIAVEGIDVPSDF
jgi:hypothetical protein